MRFGCEYLTNVTKSFWQQRFWQNARKVVDIGFKANDVARAGITRDWIFPHAYVEMNLQPCVGVQESKEESNTIY